VSIDGTQKQTILCLDDDKELLKLLRMYLTEDGYNVVTSDDYSQVAELVSQHKPIAITLDTMSSHREDGWDILNELQADEELRDIPIVIISLESDQAHHYARGSIDFISKPIEPNILIDVINRLTKKEMIRALVVDDNPDVRELMEVILQNSGIETYVAVDGYDALAVLEKLVGNLPDIIILDLIMPNMDGFELLKKLTEKKEWSTIPIIVVTAKILEPSEYHFLRNRVVSVLAKDSLATDHVLEQLSLIMKDLSSTSVST